MPAGLFHVQPSSGVPIWRQLTAQVRALRAGGRLSAGDALPSVRELAGELAVNPMTVSKAWSQLERDGIVEHVRGVGMRIRPLPRGGDAARRLAEIDPLLRQVADRARQLDLDANATVRRLRELMGDQP